MKWKIFPVNVFIILMLTFLSLQCKKDNKSAVQNTASTWDTVFVDNYQRANGPLGNNYSVQVASGNGRADSILGTANILNNQLSFEGYGLWAIRDTTGVPGNVVRVSINCIVEKGNPNFGIAVQSQNLGYNWRYQEFYAAFIGSNKIGIFKYINTVATPQNYPDTLVSSSLIVQNGHTYKLQFVANNKNLSAYINDLNTGSKDSVKYIDNGTTLTGTIVSLNGNNANTTDLLLFDNFIIEKGK